MAVVSLRCPFCCFPITLHFFNLVFVVLWQTKDCDRDAPRKQSATGFSTLHHHTHTHTHMPQQSANENPFKPSAAAASDGTVNNPLTPSAAAAAARDGKNSSRSSASPLSSPKSEEGDVDTEEGGPGTEPPPVDSAPQGATEVTMHAAPAEPSFEEGAAAEPDFGNGQRVVDELNCDDVLHNADEIPSMIEGRTEMQSLRHSALSVVTLFNSIFNIMLVLAAFKRETQAELAEAKFRGTTSWTNLTLFMIYAPLGFFVLILHVVHNFSSERLFYDYLRRCILLTFPNSSELRFFFGSAQPVIFFFFFSAYCIICIVVLALAEAHFGTIVAFISNMLFGVAPWWYGQQSVQSRFVSLPDFVMLFPQEERRIMNLDERIDQHHTAVIDAWNLKCATHFLRRLAVVKATDDEHFPAPTYSSSVRKHNWGHAGTTKGMQALLYSSLGFLLVICIAICFVAFLILSGSAVSDVWSTQLNPCTSVCSNASSSHGGAAFGNHSCFACLCDCIRRLRKNTDEYRVSCASSFGVPEPCNKLGLAAQDVCRALSSCGNYIKLE